MYPLGQRKKLTLSSARSKKLAGTWVMHRIGREFTSPGLHFLGSSAVLLMLRAARKASPDALLSFVARGELFVEIYRSTDQDREMARLQAALGTTPVIYPTKETVNIYAQPAARLQQIGRPIPTNDLWIAALALEWELPLLTDDAHFTRVRGLKVLSVRRATFRAGSAAVGQNHTMSAVGCP